MHIFAKLKNEGPQVVTRGRFEIERNGAVAFLEYALAGTILELIHTEVPASMKGTGVASSLAETALQWAREHQVKVDVICPFVAGYLSKHPEFSDLLVR